MGGVDAGRRWRGREGSQRREAQIDFEKKISIKDGEPFFVGVSAFVLELIKCLGDKKLRV